MASAGLEKELECSICLSLYTDPVTLRCGHNFCRVCIDQHLNTQEGSRAYSCPDCREEFRDRPELKKNITLCNVVENVQSTQSHQEEISGIRCTYCVDSPAPAVRSCLHCEASLCDQHLRVHSKGPEHVLTEPSTDLEKRKCPVHKKVLEYYCTEDSACICVSCSLAGEHRGHQVEMLDEASKNKKKKLKDVLWKLITKREKTEERVQSLEEQWGKAQEKASGDAKRVTALFIDIRRRLDYLEKEILSEISRQEKQRSLSLSDRIHKLEIKKDELSMNIRHIEELCKMSDPLTVLQDPDTGDLYDPEEEGDDEDTGGDDEDDEDTGEDDEDDRGVEFISKISHMLSDITRDGSVVFYMQDPADILLDVNSAHNNLLISDDLKTATWTDTRQNRPETAKRFQDNPQVISSRRFTSGRHYWDVEVGGSGFWSVGVCYPSIARRGPQSFIGDNNKSWCLNIGKSDRCSVIHDSEAIELSHEVSSNRFRIYLDYEAGQLSFYELCDPIRRLCTFKTFTTTFTEPLHAALWVFDDYIKIAETSAAQRHDGRR
ncbi:E3 ubiquitin-protein ligase TRIM39-like [Leptodactylus fuscus]|uniref:E3 ubiquitin-protein ligase TRIM39-like n=1 Tax=Leptodactylus fuscus TaxID=238119 RepID=UPI003F4F2859